MLMAVAQSTHTFGRCGPNFMCVPAGAPSQILRNPIGVDVSTPPGDIDN